ncbi:MAG: FtsX-like permease family protein [Candidatus Cloacimonadaceae bacterium]|nr:FtsX-like permease family protein [Candidatus Cloacimonadaceae bacterium]
MFGFILKGILRDRSRTLFPILVVGAGVLIIVFTLAFMQGYTDSIIRQNARYETGHVKIVTNAYAELINQKPYDLVLLSIEDEIQEWKTAYPEITFVPRITFGALLDVPDPQGNTRAQGDVFGYAVDLGLGSPSQDDAPEIKHLNLREAIVEGHIPSRPGEIMLSHKAFERLELALGDTITLIGATAFGSMAFQNFRIAGTLIFGFEALDRGGIIADIDDIRHFLDMEDGAGEILGFFNDGKYQIPRAERFKNDFNSRFSDSEDEFSPVMLNLTDQNNMASLIRLMDFSLDSITVVFIFIMGIVLWNSGLMNCIRRYGEIGVRLAMGERKHHLYMNLLAEAALIGILGSALGTVLGLLVSSYFNAYGLDVSAYNRESSIMSESIIYTTIDLKTTLWGFIPGVASTILGAMLAGLVIFKRKTSQLFKELEV